MPDPFVAAAARLQNLIRGTGSGEDELMDKLVANESPESRLRTSAALGGLMCAAAAVTVALCTKEPWSGGLPATDAWLSWAALGALAGLPLVGLRLWSWTPAASQSLPAFEDMHRTRLRQVEPWLQRMSRVHLAGMMVCEVVPTTLLLLPAAQSVIAAWSNTASSLPPLGPAVQEAAGSGGPSEALVRLAGLVLTAIVAAVGHSTDMSPSQEEYEVIQTAIDNSDRYYRLTSTDVQSRAGNADQAALAFRCVAQIYLETRSDAALLAGALTFFEVLFLGGLYFLSGMNVAAPVAAAMASSWVDYYHLHQAVEGDSGGQGQGQGQG